jgi:hypothetical protein
MSLVSAADINGQPRTLLSQAAARKLEGAGLSVAQIRRFLQHRVQSWAVEAAELVVRARALEAGAMDLRSAGLGRRHLLSSLVFLRQHHDDTVRLVTRAHQGTCLRAEEAHGERRISKVRCYAAVFRWRNVVEWVRLQQEFLCLRRHQTYHKSLVLDVSSEPVECV